MQSSADSKTIFISNLTLPNLASSKPIQAIHGCRMILPRRARPGRLDKVSLVIKNS